MDADTLRRLITNQRAEHVPHAFRAGAAGMADFARLIPVLRALPATELAGWLDRIDSLRATHRACLPCTAKILAYSLIAARGRLRDRAAHHQTLYDNLMRSAPAGRDYLAEVRASLGGATDSPAAAAHRRFWRAVSLDLALRPPPHSA